MKLVDEHTLSLLEEFRRKWEPRCSDKENATAFGHRASNSAHKLLDTVRTFRVGSVKGIYKDKGNRNCEQLLEKSVSRLANVLEKIETDSAPFQINSTQESEQKRHHLADMSVYKPLLPTCEKIFYIIVPPAVSSQINLTNIGPFLNEGVFNEPSVAAFPSRPRHVNLSPNTVLGDSSHTFKAIDDPRYLKNEDWHNVLACFVMGKDWQFDGWFGCEKGKLPVASILSSICGFYLASEGESVPKKIHEWNVTVTRMNHNDKDKLAARMIWEDILGAANAVKPQR